MPTTPISMGICPAATNPRMVTMLGVCLAGFSLLTGIMAVICPVASNLRMVTMRGVCLAGINLLMGIMAVICPAAIKLHTDTMPVILGKITGCIDRELSRCPAEA